MRSALVLLKGKAAGRLTELDRGYEFVYLPEYLQLPDAEPISLTLPLQTTPHLTTRGLHAFFDGLIPEGWLLQLAIGVHQLDLRDRFGILLATGHDTIGAVTLQPLR
jgi:HipA N-terminal domain